MIEINKLLVEEWEEFDMLSMMQQLGAVPTAQVEAKSNV